MDKLTIIDQWDDTFFEKFISFRNLIHRTVPSSFIEKKADYTKFFAIDSVFRKDYQWKGFLLENEKGVVAKAILCWRQGRITGNLGFIDFVNDLQVMQKLQSAIDEEALKVGLSEIKTPVDLNFFNKYRIRCEGGGKPFFGEPIYPAYYHDIFKSLDYGVVGSWDTYQIPKIATVLNFTKRRKKFEKKTEAPQGKVTVRCLDMNKWESELEIVYHLFNTSFTSMPEFESVTLEQFKVLYDDFKYLINPLISYIVELNGVPIGFNINYADPQKILKSVEGKELNLLQKALLLGRLRLNRGPLLIAYVGSIKGPNGEEVKGIQYKTSKRLWKWGIMYEKVLVCYQSEDSPSRRSWGSNPRKIYAKYVLYGKKLK